MTYSSGMPALYWITFVSLVITYWTDKILVTRYFRKENGFTADLSRNVVNMLPWAMIIHIPFGYLMVSEPNILESSTFSSTPPSPLENQYFGSYRISQLHNVIFILGSCLVVLLMVFEPVIMKTTSTISRCTSVCWAKMKSNMKREPYLPPKDENEEMIDAPDIYWEISFAQLVKEYKN
jgi:hypothetical protein